jgi:hypothetical protein
VASAVAAAGLLTAFSPAVLAQDATAGPSGPTAEAIGVDTISPVTAELLARFPSELAGRPVSAQPLVVAGRALLEDLDPDDLDEARQLARIDDLLEIAGASIDDVTSASVTVDLPNDEFVLVGAFRITGSDAHATLEAYVDAFAVDIAEPVTERGVIAGREVLTVVDASMPRGEPFVFFASGDVTWVVVAPDDLREDVIWSLW